MSATTPTHSPDLHDVAGAGALVQIDWHEIARSPSVHRLGAMLRRQLNLWAGFVGPSGAVPIAPSLTVDKPLCDVFMGRRDAGGSCTGSVRAWLDDLAPGTAALAPSTCHVGLRAMVAPIVVDQHVVGAAYASGFIMGDADETELQPVFQRSRDLGLPRNAVSAGAKALVRLSEREVRLVGDLVTAIADEARTALGEDVALRRRVRGAAGDYTGIIGRSPVMKELFLLLDKVAESDSSVLIRGEPGVGKELVARAVHYKSARAEMPFVVQNCSAMNDSLLDSELFGHKKGAFTGAISDKQGLFELADHGSFFLDEVGDMSPMLQVKLLRVLQEGTFVPVGDTVVRKVDVRIIAATNRDLQRMMREASFRTDLYYRINVIEVPVPPLRDRREDIPLLVAHFLERKSEANHFDHVKTVTDDTLQRLCAYEWPGNVRELENEIERLVVMSGQAEEVDPALLTPRIRDTQPTAAPRIDGPSPSTHNLTEAMDALERRMLHEALTKTGWNKTRAAKLLGISRRNLIRKVDRYQLDDLRPDDV